MIMIWMPGIVAAVPAQAALQDHFNAGGDARSGVVAHVGAADDLVERLRRYIDEPGEGGDRHPAGGSAEFRVKAKALQMAADFSFLGECGRQQGRGVIEFAEQ